MSGEELPRVWVGESGPCPRIFFVHEPSSGEPTVWAWAEHIDRFDIFIPHDPMGRPTIDPAEMKTIATCSKVDW